MSTTERRQRVVDIQRPPLMEEESFCAELAELCQKLDITEGAAREEVERCLDELAIEPRDRYLNWSARLARFMYSRSYDPILDVDTEALAKLQDQAKDRPLVFLWSHKSHLDSFVFMRAIFDSEFRPQPLSFAGINMAFAGFGTLARNSGAIFLRRSFKGADVYKLVFRHYVRYLIEKRAPLSWSIEGTRSRTGKLMPPKPGLLQWVLEALEANGDDSALFVPVSITFDQIAEMDDYIAINRGEPKRKESLGWFLGYIFGMQESAGKIHVRFGEPAGLEEPGEVPDALLQTSADPKQARTLQLALEVSRRIEHNTLVTPQSLVCLALLASEGCAVSREQLRHRLDRLRGEVSRAGLPCAAGLEQSLGAGLQRVLDNLAGSGMLREQDGWRINPERALGASYYRNTVSHYFLYAALGELALAGTPDDASDYRNAIAEAVLHWRGLLKFEYVFLDRETSVDLALAHIDRSYPDWEQLLAQGDPAFGGLEPVFARGILVSVLEAYRLFAGNSGGEQFCDDVARESLERAVQLDGPLQSAASLPLMENAQRLINGIQRRPESLRAELASALQSLQGTLLSS